MIVLVLLSALLASVFAAQPNDQITLTEFNQTLYIADEVYNFTLVPAYWVPLRSQKYTIFTASTQGQASITKRVLWQKRHVLTTLAPEDHELLENQLGSLPSYVRVDANKKRSFVNAAGSRVIELAPGHSIFVLEEGATEKRSVEQSPIAGQVICLHIPFFTTCDNSADLTQVKAAIQAQNDELQAELDSYEQTNDARNNELTVSLNKQRQLITQIAQTTQTNLQLIQSAVSVEKTNLVQTQHGDMIIQAQVNALKRVANAILRFDNAMASTDPRQVVAQPSMSKLFQGYLAAMAVLASQGNNTVVDSRQFNWTEQILPADSVKNVTVSTDPLATDPTIYYGFPAVTQMLCGAADWDNVNNFCLMGGNRTGPVPDPSATGVFLGPFHTNHYGLYPVVSTTGVVLNTREARIISQGPPIPLNIMPSCINWLGFTALANFTTTPGMLDGIPSGVPAASFSDCSAYALTSKNSGTTNYRLFSLSEGITIPFYSNCDIPTLTATAGLTLPTGYFSTYPNTTGSANLATDTFPWGIYTMHQVTNSCYINLDPDWLGLSYYIYPFGTVINNIPRGYRMNQFTINPAGELSSSLEFLYTPGWALMYTIQRTSTNLAPGGNGNKIIVDEVDVLDGSKVLFFKNSLNTIIDASDHINGIGNSGRDCVQQPLFTATNALNDPTQPGTYDYDILDCFFQNDQVGVPIATYLKGLVRTTGISRFNSKFTINFQDTTISGMPSYNFQLTPLPYADFNFYAATTTDICPQVTSRSVLPDKCQFNFFYSGTSPVSVGNISVTFTSSIALNVDLPVSDTPYIITVGNKSCMQVTCAQTLTSTYVKLDTPQVSIISADDLALQARLYVSLDSLIAGTVNSLSAAEIGAQQSYDKINNITALLATINFNMSELFPYENFSALRAQVDAVTAQIGTNYCNSPWQSVQCWFKDFGSAVIAIGIALVLAIGIFLFMTKTTAGKRIQNKLCGDEGCGGGAGDEAEEAGGYASDGHQYSPDGDFQLLSTN